MYIIIIYIYISNHRTILFQCRIFLSTDSREGSVRATVRSANQMLTDIRPRPDH